MFGLSSVTGRDGGEGDVVRGRYVTVPPRASPAAFKGVIRERTDHVKVLETGTICLMVSNNACL